MRKARFAAAGSLLLLLLAASAGRFLVVDHPQKSDVILVLAGETDRRPARALELLVQGYAAKVILNVQAKSRVYQRTQQELAEEYVASLPQAQAITVCPISGLSTKDEARDAARCLESAGGHDVLLVTSDFHTRRALSAFRHEIPNYNFSVAAAHDPQEFGVQWWKHRQWAKTLLDEWLRLLWWEAIDRWR